MADDLDYRPKEPRDESIAELDRIGFDRFRDRLFSTGDLIDRGPDSVGTLELVREPWFYFVKGNHESDLPLFLEYQYPAPEGATAARESGQDWVYDLGEDALNHLKAVLLPLIDAAPLVLHVGGDQGFWMVHADRGKFGSYGNPLPLLDDARLPHVTGDDQLEALLWSRRLLKQIPKPDLTDRGLYLVAPGAELAPGVGLTFVGHTYVERPVLYRSHLFLDIGAGTVPNGKLTVLRVRDVLPVG